ncbi:hypothetical protein BaRGS_00002670 [Batillaria attramentaria]|uniref:PID domain-containing protein n=1 Tax=Batillaria attramentaria TaxID=370345 RepID=A0ABD0M3L2_9CAEN
MDGPTYACDYLGYSTLSKPATGIASLQAPVKDMYLKFRKNAVSGASPRKATFKITPGGLVVALQEGANQTELFFDISSVNFIEAVRFAVLRGTEKKPKAVFLPLDESRGPISEKVAFSLEKQFHFLVQSGHQPLLVCVLRRPKGVKALDCHVFAMDSPENALYVVSLVQQLLSGAAGKDFPTSAPPPASLDSNFNRGGTRGDFIRTEFGEYNMEPGLGPRGGGQPNPRETYPAESAERPRFGWSYDKPQSGEEFRRISGQYPPDGRPVSGGEVRPGNQYPDDVRPGNQYYGDGRPGNQYPGDRRSNEGYGVGVGGGGPPFDPMQGGYRRQDYERAEISHVRERSGDSSDSRGSGLARTGSDRPPGGRQFDDPGLGARAGYQDPRYGPPRAEGPPKVMEKPQSPIRNPGAPTFPTGGGQAPVSPRRGPDSPPFSPTSQGVGPTYSLSNRESQEEIQGKPVAKVLPSDFLAVKLKPKQQRSESEDSSSHDYDNQKNIMQQYKQLQELEAQQGFQGFEDRDLDKAGQQRRYNDNWNDDGRGGGGGPGPGYDQQYRPRYQQEDDRRYIEQYTTPGGPGADDVQMRGHPHRYEQPPAVGKNRYSAPTYAEADRPGDRNSGGEWRSQSSYEMGQGVPRQVPGGYPRGGAGGAPGEPARGTGAPSSAASDETQMGRKKDAEIASMFSNFRLQGSQDPYAQDRNHFEEGLGYLP